MRDIEVDLSIAKPAKGSHGLIPEFEVNRRYLLLFVLTMGINGICVAWTTGGNNQTASIFEAKLGWNAEETRFNNSLINVCSQLGKTLGAFFGGQIISSGRKRVFVIYNILALFSCLIMQIVSIETLAMGKFLNGFFVTVVHIT